MPATPRVSIAMAVYNAAPFVMRTIESALAQTMADFEYVIVDDASTDDTADVVAGVGDERIRLVRRTGNAGPSVARNQAVRESSGELVAVLDHDDLWFEGRLESLVRHLDEHPDTGLVSSDMYVGDPDRPDDSRTILTNPSCSGLSIPDPRAWARGCGFSPSTALVRRELFDRHGYYDESLFYSQDWEIGLRFWLHGERPAMLAQPMGWTLKRAGQASENVWGVFEERLSVLRRALVAPDVPKGFREAAKAEIRHQQTDGARVVLGEAMASGDPARIRREAIWAARYHLHGTERLKSLALAVWPRAAGPRRQPNGEPPSGGLFEKPRDEFPRDDR
jgi:glycosyltransferase involved in cell wall biosynthesis